MENYVDVCGERMNLQSVDLHGNGKFEHVKEALMLSVSQSVVPFDVRKCVGLSSRLFKPNLFNVAQMVIGSWTVDSWPLS